MTTVFFIFLQSILQFHLFGLAGFKYDYGFSKLLFKNTQILHFRSQISSFLFFTELTYWHQIPIYKYPNKTFWSQLFNYFVLDETLLCWKVREYWFPTWQYLFKVASQKYLHVVDVFSPKFILFFCLQNFVLW